MRLFMPLFAALGLLLLLAGPAQALDLVGISPTDISDSWDKLDPVAQAEMAAEIARKAKEAETPSLPVPTVEASDVEPWLGLIDKVGDGLVKLAKDLGVTANELLASPVGVITVGLVAYHVMGEELIEFVNAFFFAIVIFPLLVIFFFKSVIPVQGYQEFEVDSWRGKRRVVKALRRKPVFGDKENFNQDWLFAVMAALATLSFIALLP